MFNASAEFYDLIYSSFKDYGAETAQIANLLRRMSPRCKTVLDVACGTGGTRRASEVHELGLFTVAELLEAFRQAGLRAEYDPKGLTDRGLYVARA
jgi:hypothetical protein